MQENFSITIFNWKIFDQICSKILNDNLYAVGMGCMKYGDEYKEGEEFAKNHLRYLCKNGMAIIIGKVL